MATQHIDNGIEGEGMKKLKKKVESIAEKYADLVEKRIDNTEELTGENLKDIYSGIQMLGHIAMTFERLSRMENGNDPVDESFPGMEG